MSTKMENEDEKSDSKTHMSTKMENEDEKSDSISSPHESEEEAGFSSAEEDEDEDNGLPTLSAAFQERVRPFIDLIDHLRQFGLDKDVGLPAVVVIGDQSAGKSSTLEAISGIQLPRGSGIVTRCPLELRLKSHPKHDMWRARISYQKKGDNFIRNIDNPAMVGEEVLDAQNALAGRRKGITLDLITLEVEAHGIPDLTLIDLPGITRIAVQDQPEDIGDQIKKLIMKYIKKPETIILAVVPANVDIATTEALKLAMGVDPKGTRTLGVVTKPDLIDRGTESELMAVVGNMRYHLAKGFTVVKCRGQVAIDSGQTLGEAMKNEQQFFANHETLSNLDPMLCGIKNLSNKLTHELVNHIKASIPALKEDVKARLQESQAHLYSLGAGLPEEPGEKTVFLVQLLDSFVNVVSQVSHGDYEGVPANMRLRLYTQARKLYEKFASDLWAQVPYEGSHHVHVKNETESREEDNLLEEEDDYNDVDDHTYALFDDDDDDDDEGDKRSMYEDKNMAVHIDGANFSNRIMIDRIRKEIDEQRGRELPRVWKFSILEMFIRENLTMYHNPAFKCLTQVNTILENVLANLASAKLDRFPRLEMNIKTLVNELRTNAFASCQDKMKEFFAMEEQIFTQDPVYLEKLASHSLSFSFDKLLSSLRKQGCSGSVSGHVRTSRDVRRPKARSSHDKLQEERRKREAQIKARMSPTSGFSTQAPAMTLVQRVNNTCEKFNESKVAEATAMFEAIRAYLEVATSRIVDIIPMIITYQMLECLSKEVRGQVLSLAADRATLELLEEDKVVAHRRMMLEHKISRLTSATWELAKF